MLKHTASRIDNWVSKKNNGENNNLYGSTFHKSDLDWFAHGDTDDDAFDSNNLVGPITAAVQKQQAKKTAGLPKNNIFDPIT